jgi:hypothetical protein
VIAPLLIQPTGLGSTHEGERKDGNEEEKNRGGGDGVPGRHYNGNRWVAFEASLLALEGKRGGVGGGGEQGRRQGGLRGGQHSGQEAVFLIQQLTVNDFQDLMTGKCDDLVAELDRLHVQKMGETGFTYIVIVDTILF